MLDVVRNGVVMGGFAAVVALVGWDRRWRHLGGGLLAVVALVVAVALGMLPVADFAVWLPSFPWRPLCWLGGWAAVGLLVRGAGGVADPFSGWTGPFVGGAAFGPWCVAHLPEEDPSVTARRVLVAVAGSLVGPLGTGAAFLLGGPSVSARLAVLSVLLVVMAWPWSLPKVPAPRSLLGLAGVALGVALAGFPEVALAVGLAGGGSVAWMSRRGGTWRGLPSGTGRALAWAMAVAVGSWLLVPAGLPSLLVDLLTSQDMVFPSSIPPIFATVALAVSALCGALPVTLLGALCITLRPDVLSVDVATAVVAGVATGAGLRHLHQAGPGVLRRGALRWTLQAILLVGWICQAFEV